MINILFAHAIRLFLSRILPFIVPDEVIDGLGCGGRVYSGMIGIRILSGGMVTPYDDILDIGYVDVEPLGYLA